MRTHRLVVTAVFATLTLSLAVGCGGHGRPTTAPQPGAAEPHVLQDSGSALVLPPKLRSYTLTETKPLEPGQGTMYRYSNGSATRLDVFVYPVPADVRTGRDSGGQQDLQRWVTREGEKFAQVLPIGVQRGWYDDFSVAFQVPAPITQGGTTLPGFAAAAATRAHGRVSVELEYLYLVRGRLLKVRATVPEATWTQTDVPSFAKELATWLAAAPDE